MILLFHLSNLHSERNHILSFFTGQFDIIDKEGYKTYLVGFEHNDENLFRDTREILPVSGIELAKSLYFYTGTS